jgi:hypothetical protein
LDDNDETAHRAKSIIERVRREVLANGYDFNTDIVDFVPDTTGKVPISASYLKVRFPHGLSYRVDGTARYVWDVEESEFYDETLRDVEVVFDLSTFSHIPDMVGRWIAYRAAIEFFVASNAPEKQVPTTLQALAIKSRTTALNSMNNVTIHGATGWNTLKHTAYAGAAVKTDRVWIIL